MKIRKERSDGALSDVISTILMLALAISLFAGVYLSFQNISFATPPPSADIVGYIDGNDVILEHHGGEALSLDMQVLIRVGDTLNSLIVRDYLDSDATANGWWNIGEKVVYSAGNITGLQVKVSVIDADSSYMILTGVLQEGDLVTPPTINIVPELSNPSPSNGSTDINIIPQLSIDISDENGHTMNISWYSNSSGSWILFGKNLSCSNGTYYQNNSNFSDYGTTYWWKINLSDGNDGYSEEIYHFTTESVILNTSVNTIIPYEITSTQISINSTSTGVNPDNVTLYYRWSNNNWTTSWTMLTYDDFENGFGNYSIGGGDCSLYTGGTFAHQGNNAADIQDNSGDDSSFYHTSGIDVDTPGYTSIKVDFWFYAVSMEDGRDFWVQFYDGSSWNTVADYDSEDEFVNGQFYHEIVWINETDYTFPSDMKIKFRCDALNDNDDVYIDEIYVNATSGISINWVAWNDALNPDNSSPWSWIFNFPNSMGYYEFYSIGKKSGISDETSPNNADAICYYNPS